MRHSYGYGHASLARLIRKPTLSINTIAPTPRIIRPNRIAWTPRVTPAIPKCTARQFTSSASLYKKKDKPKQKADESTTTEPESSAADPFDLTQLHDGVADALARLNHDLQKLRSGGRLNPEVIESLRVTVDKNSNETVKLGELAQVVPKGGRAVAIIMGDEAVRFTLPYSSC